MKLSELERKEIKKIFYQDEFGEIGIEDKSKEFHLIEYGNIYLELADNSIFEIVNDDEKEGITITKIENSYKDEFVDNEIKNDTFWSQISNKSILQIKTYKDSYLETIGNKTTQKEVISTIEIVFKNGERIFISNAGYVNKEKILGMTGDFMVYKKRKVGLKLNLINE